MYQMYNKWFILFCTLAHFSAKGLTQTGKNYELCYILYPNHIFDRNAWIHFYLESQINKIN